MTLLDMEPVVKDGEDGEQADVDRTKVKDSATTSSPSRSLSDYELDQHLFSGHAFEWRSSVVKDQEIASTDAVE